MASFPNDRPRSWYRPFRGTLLVFALIFGLGVVVNCGGDLRDESHVSGKNPVEYGWPWRYALWRMRGDGQPTHWTEWWRIDRIIAWEAKPLLANGAFWLAVALVVAGLWQWRSLHRKRAFQITLADAFVGLSLAGVVCAWLASAYEDARAERRFRKVIGGDVHYSKRDLPADWFWETLHIPDPYQPTRRTYYLMGSNVWDIRSQPSPEAMRELGRARYLDRITFRRCDFDPTSWRDAEWPRLTSLTFDDCALTDEHWQAFPAPPQLANVHIHGGKFSDEALTTALAKCPSLRKLSLVYQSQFQSHTLSRLSKLESLSLTSTGIDEAGMAEIGKLTNLRHLRIACHNGTSNTSSLGWAALANLENLESFELDVNLDENATFDDRALASLARLPKLKTLKLQYHTNISDAGLAVLKEFPALEEVDFHFNDLCHVTDIGIDHITEMARRRKLKSLWVEIETGSYAAYARLAAVVPDLHSFTWQFRQEMRELGYGERGEVLESD